MNAKFYRETRNIPLIVLVSLLLVLQGCATKRVADYDAAIKKEIITISKQVDTFYGELIETEESARKYDAFKEKYIEIEVGVRALIMQNKARPLNDESVSISETTIKKWIKYKNKHKSEDRYKTVLAENHRERFTRLFTAMLVAEKSKKM